jgi:hypothetical protein
MDAIHSQPGLCLDGSRHEEMVLTRTIVRPAIVRVEPYTEADPVVSPRNS